MSLYMIYCDSPTFDVTMNNRKKLSAVSGNWTRHHWLDPLLLG